jgi:putative phosphoserine phosphatase/1-acylglycerol-3-phosphate O-acyltransferase
VNGAPSGGLHDHQPQAGSRPSARLRGPEAEVDASPEGADVGAFFDLDGTLVAGFTAAAQTRDRLRRRDLRVVEFLTVVELAVQVRLGRRAFETLIEGSARTVKGRLARDVDESGERIFRQSVADRQIRTDYVETLAEWPAR